jgi:glycosyltransferase involved in cell wall biosynthesis
MSRQSPLRSDNAARRPSVLIAHDFTETYSGAERIIAAAASVLPEAPFWTIAGRQSVAERMGVGDRFHTVLPRSEALLRHYRLLAPAYPRIVRHRPLPKADVLLTSSYAFAHGFRTRNDAPQVCFCYSPLRFLWSMTEAYGEWVAPGPLRRRAFEAMVGAMRRADRRAAARVTHYVAESRHVAEQIRHAYGRESEVIYPPVDCGHFRPSKEPGHDGYFLFCGRLVEPYKRPGIVIEAFRSLPHRLVVAGDGPAYKELKERAGDNVEFLGLVGDEELVPLMQRCAASIFPSLDDFGLVPVETMACGRPVLAFAGGGALETVVAGKTGEFFGEPTATNLLAALQAFEPDSYDSAAIRFHAQAWDVPRFQEAILRAVEAAAGGPEAE